jgi:hypothetical protein
MTLSALGIFSAAGAGVVSAGAYELISSTILGTAQSSIVFDVTGLGSTYKHLQIRAVARSSRSDTNDNVYIRFNGDTANNYSTHFMWGNGTNALSSGLATQPYIYAAGALAAANSTANAFGAFYVDILDPFSTTKNKTTRALSGNPILFVEMDTGNWRSTSATTSLTLSLATGPNFLTGSRFSIYGLKG